MLRHTLPFISLCFLLLSCNTQCFTKDSFITSYDEFIESASSDIKSSEHISSLDESFKSYTNECYKKFQDEMSNSEKLHFWKQTIKYQTSRYETDDLKEILSPELQQMLERDLETFTTEGKEELIKLFREDIAPEFNQVIDEVIKGIEGIGESLKDWIKTIEDK